MCIFLLQSKPLRIFIATTLEAKIQKWRQPTRNATGLRDGHADNRASEQKEPACIKVKPFT